MSVDALDDLFAKLNVEPAARGDVGFSSQHVVFTAWKQPPSRVHLSPTLDQDELRRILKQDLAVGSDPAGIAQLRTTVPASIRFQPFSRHVEPEAKPNLLVLVTSIFHRYLQDHADADVTADQLIASLGDFDMLMPRNPLKKVLAAAQSPSETWEVYAMRPIADGPLFVDRTKSYPTNPGSIGMLFTKAMTTQPTTSDAYHRVYAVRAGRFGSLKIALMGEVDCVDPDDATVVEIKSKPEWAKRDETRDVETYIQCKLAGVETLVTGKFSATRGVRDGPVTFAKRNVSFQSLEAFGANLRSKTSAAFAYGNRVLRELEKACTEVGQVYHATGYLHGKTTVRAVDGEEMTFPVSSKLLRELAQVMATAERTTIT